jgi:hypothetical protein
LRTWGLAADLLVADDMSAEPLEELTSESDIDGTWEPSCVAPSASELFSELSEDSEEEDLTVKLEEHSDRSCVEVELSDMLTESLLTVLSQMEAGPRFV